MRTRVANGKLKGENGEVKAAVNYASCATNFGDVV